MIPQVVKWIRFLAETIHVGFKTTFCKSKIKKYQWALLIGIENPVFHVRRPMKRSITVEIFRKKIKSTIFQGIINFSQFYWNDRKFPVPLLHVDYKCQASTRAKAKNLPFFFFFFSSRRMPIVLGTFTSSSTKFVDLSYHAWTLWKRLNYWLPWTHLDAHLNMM